MAYSWERILKTLNYLVVDTNYLAINSSDALGLCIYCSEYEIHIKACRAIESIQQKLIPLKEERAAAVNG